MAPQARNQRSDVAPTRVDRPLARPRADPVMRLQRMIGNRATAQLLSREPAAQDHGTVKIGKLPAITIVGGNAGDWAAKGTPDTLEITSETGKHSAQLERLCQAKSTVPSLTVTVPVAQSGQNLNFGSVEIEFVNAHIAGYTVAGDHESWRAVDFEAVHRTTTSRRSGI